MSLAAVTIGIGLTGALQTFAGETKRPVCRPCASGNGYPVHLTFDDGPHPVLTAKILETLSKQKVSPEQPKISATFFVLGENLDRKNPKFARSVALLEQAHRDGHTLGSHTYSHINHVKGRETQRERELNIARAWGDYSGPHSKYMRFPYGEGWLRMNEPGEQETKEHIWEFAKKQNYRHTGWDIDSFDWHKTLRDEAPESILKQVCAHEGGVALFHDIQPWTAENLPMIIESLRCSGHKIVSMREIEEYNAENPRVAFEDNVVTKRYCRWPGPLTPDQIYRKCEDRKPTENILSPAKPSEGAK